MSEPENVLSRWSRLKRQHASYGREGAGSTPSHVGEATAYAKSATNAQAPAASFDVASLPPIESIVAGSDIRAFLQKGVPAALVRAALRQAWSSDPAIRDFIEIAENQWDFARPETIPGFGPLGPSDEVQSLVAQALGELRKEAASLREAPKREGEAIPSPAGEPAIGAPLAADASAQIRGVCRDQREVEASDPEPLRALQHGDGALANTQKPSGKPRKHGGAMPS
jgi:hypothetical protein